MALTRRGLLMGAVGFAVVPAVVSAPAQWVGAGVDPGRAPAGVREFWLSAQSWLHNVVPNGTDAMMNVPMAADQVSYWAIGYRAWTPNWGALLPGDDLIGPNTGMPGPVIRAHVGDRVRIHFRNDDEHYRFPHSIHVHGLRYEQSSDGAWIASDPERPGTAVEYGESYTYEYTAVESSVGTWPYHDHSVPQALAPGAHPTGEIGAQLGLAGVIAVTERGSRRPDVENVLVMNGLSPDTIPDLKTQVDVFNGYAFLDNAPTFTARVGDRVRWRIVSMSNDMHVFHLHGHRWRYGPDFVDSTVLGPSTALTIDYVEDSPGDWFYHCHVSHHMMAGMLGRYHVT